MSLLEVLASIIEKTIRLLEDLYEKRFFQTKQSLNFLCMYFQLE